jgi:hypothetical protein
MRFKKENKTLTVYRKGTTTESGYTKTNYTSTGKSYTGFLKASSIKDLIDKDMFGKEFQFNTDASADIQKADRLVDGPTMYDVKGVSSYDGVSFSRIMCILSIIE